MTTGVSPVILREFGYQLSALSYQENNESRYSLPIADS
jgi:hypothetical protein